MSDRPSQCSLFGNPEILDILTNNIKSSFPLVMIKGKSIGNDSDLLSFPLRTHGPWEDGVALLRYSQRFWKTGVYLPADLKVKAFQVIADCIYNI